MGREAKVKKDRRCRKCGDTFLNLNSAQIEMHAFVCEFEKKSGIQIIKMSDDGSGENAVVE